MKDTFIFFILISRINSIVGTVPKCSKQLVGEFLHTTARYGLTFFATGVAQSPALASTYFDTEVYGDKELKIAAVNKIKQKVRNAILENPQLAAKFLKVSINDALGYDQSTNSGGADGSVLLEQSSEENRGLDDALMELSKIKRDLQRTLSVSFADICAFAGAEAMESVGCDRTPVQLGRFDTRSSNRKSNTIAWLEPTATGLLTAFAGSGLDANAVVVLLGAVGEINRIVAESKDNTPTSKSDDEFEQQPFVPTTFGSRDAIYGMKVGKSDFGSTYFRAILQDQLPLDAIGTTLVSNPTTKEVVVKYANNDASFRSDLVKTYLKLTSLGELYTTRNS